MAAITAGREKFAMGTVRPAVRLRSRAFSLVEMLTVIVIIGILGSMITAAVIRAGVAGKNAAIKLEIGKLESALGAFKEKFEEYPPDFSDQGRVVNFLVRAFPRYTFNGTGNPTFANFAASITAAVGTYSMSATDLNPTTAIVFWLGGLPTNSSPTPPQMTGFSANAANPFESKGTTSSRIGPFFEFDPARLKRDPTNNWIYYAPPGTGPISSTAYIYFRAIPNEAPASAYSQTTSAGPDTRITPYYSTALGGFASPATYQIITTGLDGRYGETTGSGWSTYPGAGATGYHADNVTSFTKATTIEAEK